MNIEEFVKYMREFSSDNKHSTLRQGQWAFNVLHKMQPDIAELIAGTDCDPFYDDKNISKFLKKILEYVK